MPAVAVTDTNNLFGALEASELLSEEGIQSITAIELKVYIEGDHCPRTPHGYLSSVVLLAQNETGYKNIMKLSSQAYLSHVGDDEVGVSLDVLLAHQEGIICLSGGPYGPIDCLLAAGRGQEAGEIFDRFHHAFGPQFYIEVQRHPSLDETAEDGSYPTEPALLKYAFEKGVAVVATNNVFFAKREDHDAHDALLCIAGGNYISQTERRQVSEDHYFKSPQEMSALFEDLPEAIEASVEIARRCAFRPRTFPPILPSFAGDLEGEKQALRTQAEEGLRARLTTIPLATEEKDYWDRLEIELGIINRMGFPGYFLIVADFIQWAKANDIPVGPGRGSGAGSLVAYALTITDLDPLRFNLLFERFLNPERVSMPDFDIDFC
ncbi:MAG: PHP domain-containing protein, partial [Pseudomonadota bacterium]